MELEHVLATGRSTCVFYQRFGRNKQTAVRFAGMRTRAGGWLSHGIRWHQVRSVFLGRVYARNHSELSDVVVVLRRLAFSWINRPSGQLIGWYVVANVCIGFQSRNGCVLYHVASMGAAAISVRPIDGTCMERPDSVRAGQSVVRGGRLDVRLAETLVIFHGDFHFCRVVDQCTTIAIYYQ